MTDITFLVEPYGTDGYLAFSLGPDTGIAVQAATLDELIIKIMHALDAQGPLVVFESVTLKFKLADTHARPDQA